MNCLTLCCGGNKINVDRGEHELTNQSNNKQNIINKVKTFTINANEEIVK